MRSIACFGCLLSCIHLTSPARASADFELADGQTWAIEIGMGGGWPPGSSAYTRTLQTFGFEHVRTTRFRFSAGVEKIVAPFFSILLQTNLLDRREWDRESGIGPDDRFFWSSWALDVHFRVFVSAANRFRGYVQLGVGPTFTGSRLYVRTGPGPEQARHREVDIGYNVAGLGGVEVLVAKHIGFYLQGGYFYSPTPENRLGDRHQSGGGLLLGGMSGHFGRKR